MAHYLTKENCTIEKKHYSVLLRFVNAWEEAFWNEEKPQQRLFSDYARYYTGLLLFKAYNDIAANTLDHLFKQELIQINPMLAWSAELATREIK